MPTDIQADVAQESVDNVEEQLAFIRGVVERCSPSKEMRRDIATRIRSITKRRWDRSLYLAIVGEFNSGKSTFINALLRDPLLKARMVATTAAETRLVHGKELAVEVTGTTGETASIREGAGRCPYYGWFPQIADLTAREIIPVVTDESECANLVTRVQISHPAEFLAGGTVLIDTPGTNATYEAHGAITKRIIEEQADMAVILTPANQPVSQSLAIFLNGPLKPMAHRCVFVLTKMDLVPGRQRDEVIEFVSARLREAVGRPKVTVMVSAPQIVLDCSDPECEVGPDDRRWADAFGELESSLHQRLREQKQLAITEHLLRLMTDLFQQMESEVKQSWSAHQAKGALIAQQSIRDLDAFLGDQSKQVHERRESAARQARTGIDSFISRRKTETIERIRKGVFATSHLPGLQAYLSASVQSEASGEGKLIVNKLRQEASAYADVMNGLAAGIKSRFEQEYAKLGSFAVHLTEQPSIDTKGFAMDLSLLAGSAKTVADEFEKGDNKAMGGGAVGGAVLGTMILPGIGTVIGGFLGALAGAASTPSFDTQRERIWQSLQPQLTKHFDEIASESRRNLRRLDGKWSSALDQYLARYGDRYRADVKKITDEHEKSLKEVQALEARARQDIEELARRKTALQITAQLLQA